MPEFEQSVVFDIFSRAFVALHVGVTVILPFGIYHHRRKIYNKKLP
jgi:hypothetical protein